MRRAGGLGLTAGLPFAAALLPRCGVPEVFGHLGGEADGERHPENLSAIRRRSLPMYTKAIDATDEVAARVLANLLDGPPPEPVV